MQRSDLSELIKNHSSWVTRLFGSTPGRSDNNKQDAVVDPWVESHNEQPFSGGYNEAFVIQFWSSYNLK